MIVEAGVNLLRERTRRADVRDQQRADVAGSLGTMEEEGRERGEVEEREERTKLTFRSSPLLQLPPGSGTR